MICDISCVNQPICVDGGLYVVMMTISVGIDIFTATTSQGVSLVINSGLND